MRMKPSYAHGVSDVPLIGKTIGDWLDEIAAGFPENEALVSVFEIQRFTYAAFLDAVNRCARSLMALSVRKGDRVGIWSTNCVAWVLAQFATAKIGAVLVNINPAYRLHELKFALQQSECNVLISGEGFKDADYLAMLHQLIPELASADPRKDFRSEKFPHLRRIILLAESPLAISQPTPYPSQEGSRPSSEPRKFPSREGPGVGSWVPGATRDRGNLTSSLSPSDGAASRPDEIGRA